MKMRDLTRSVPLLVGLAAALSQLGCEARAGLAEPGDHAAPHAAEHEGHHGGQFLVTSPLVKDTELTHDYVCQIHAIRHIELRALERGYLQEVLVDEGQHTEKGQRMFQIRPRLYRAELDRAKAEVAAARIEYENTKLLAGKEVVSASELALAKAELDKAKAEMSLRETHLRLTTVSAPFDGIMGRLEVRRGSLVEEGELLTTLSDNSTLWVYFNVTESEYLDYKARSDDNVTTRVRLILANGRTYEHPGTIETIEAAFNNETGTIAFRAAFPNPAGLLRHGQTGEVRVATPVHDALLIPQKATFEVLKKKFVFVVDDEGVVHQRQISIAAEIPHLYVVDDGLGADERIILEGLRKVTDGDVVATKYQEPADVFAHLALPAD